MSLFESNPYSRTPTPYTQVSHSAFLSFHCSTLVGGPQLPRIFNSPALYTQHQIRLFRGACNCFYQLVRWAISSARRPGKRDGETLLKLKQCPRGLSKEKTNHYAWSLIFLQRPSTATLFSAFYCDVKLELKTHIGWLHFMHWLHYFKVFIWLIHSGKRIRLHNVPLIWIRYELPLLSRRCWIWYWIWHLNYVNRPYYFSRLS